MYEYDKERPGMTHAKFRIAALTAGNVIGERVPGAPVVLAMFGFLSHLSLRELVL